MGEVESTAALSLTVLSSTDRDVCTCYIGRPFDMPAPKVAVTNVDDDDVFVMDHLLFNITSNCDKDDGGNNSMLLC